MVVTFDAQRRELRLYVDGVLEGSGSNSGSITPGDPLQIGRNDNGQEYFSGLIDDVRLYNRALTAQEVQDLYDAGNSGCS